MSIITARSLSKRYRLGALNAATLREEIQALWERWRGGTAAASAAARKVDTDFWALRDVSFDIQEGDIVGSILQDPYRMGYLSTWYCVQHLRGRDVNANRTDMSESTGEYLVTKETLNAVETLRLYDPATQADRTTEELRYGPNGKPKQ
jgi:hypothetical protein